MSGRVGSMERYYRGPVTHDGDGNLLVHDACGDVVGDLEGVDLFQTLVQLAVERFLAPAGERSAGHPYKHAQVMLMYYCVVWGKTFGRGSGSICRTTRFRLNSRKA